MAMHMHHDLELHKLRLYCIIYLALLLELLLEGSPYSTAGIKMWLSPCAYMYRRFETT